MQNDYWGILTNKMYSDSDSFEGQSLYDSFYESFEEESWDDASSDEDDDNYNENMRVGSPTCFA